MKRAAALLNTGALGAAVALAVMVVVTPMSGVHRVALLLATITLAVATMLATRLYDLDRTASRLMLASCLAFAVRAVVAPDGATLSAVTVAFAALGTVFLVSAVVVLVRQQYSRVHAGVLGDAVPVCLGAWVAAWILLINPLLENEELSPAVAVLAGALVPLAATTLYLVVMLLMSHARRPVALVMVTAGVVAALAGVVWRVLAIVNDASPHVVAAADACLVASFLLGAAGFAHPSMAILHRPHEAGTLEGPTSRLIMLTGCVSLPVLLVAVTTPSDAVDRWVRALSTIVLIVAVATRTFSALGDIRRSHDHLLEGAQTDPLTLLPNHQLLLVRINEALNETWRTASMPTVCFIDLDRFKNVNDKFGRAAGDEVLRVVGQRLRAVAPEWATVSHLAVDEYVVLDPRAASVADAQTLAESLHASLAEPLIIRGDNRVYLTASIGVAQASIATATTAHDLINHAETAKSRAQELGTNRIVMYAEAMQEKVDRRLSLELDLHKALEERQLFLEYQPILDLHRGVVVGFEALMRWRHADGTMVAPVEFIPIAEETGHISAMGRWALVEALNHLRGWIFDGQCPPDATVSVNVSPRQLADPRFPAAVQEALEQSGMNARHLWLEITESVMIADPELALQTLQAVRDLGVRIALDDFGTGYSSLSLVQQFPLQRLKIDRAFVNGLVDDDDDRQLVETIIAMGRSLGMELVAEGVETIQQLIVLRSLRCELAQGYLISRPNPPDMIGATVAGLHQHSLGSVLTGSSSHD